MLFKACRARATALAKLTAWLHVFVSRDATCYDIGDRSGDIAQRLLGQDWSGTLIHDGWRAR